MKGIIEKVRVWEVRATKRAFVSPQAPSAGDFLWGRPVGNQRRRQTALASPSDGAPLGYTGTRKEDIS